MNTKNIPEPKNTELFNKTVDAYIISNLNTIELIDELKKYEGRLVTAVRSYYLLNCEGDFREQETFIRWIENTPIFSITQDRVSHLSLSLDFYYDSGSSYDELFECINITEATHLFYTIIFDAFKRIVFK